MRPTYETANDRRAEQSFLRELREPLQCDSVVQVSKRLYPVDAIAYKGNRTVAFIEVKVRTNAMEFYPTYMISLEKFTRGAWFAECLNADYVIAVQWCDAFGFWRWRDHRLDQPKIATGGRTDRNDSDDMEPVIHLPIAEFERFELKTI